MELAVQEPPEKWVAIFKQYLRQWMQWTSDQLCTACNGWNLIFVTSFLSLQIEQGDVPVLLVGGGSALIDCSQSLFGASQVIRPLHFDVRQKCAHRHCSPKRGKVSSLYRGCFAKMSHSSVYVIVILWP